MGTTPPQRGPRPVLVLLVLVLASLQPCHPTAGVRPVQAPRPVPRCARLRGGARGGAVRLRGGGGGGGPADSVGGHSAAAGTDCSGDEALAQRLQMMETRAAAAVAVAAAGRGARGRDRPPDLPRRPAREDVDVRGRSAASTPLLAAQLLADAESRALCRHLGDRGFEGTGAAAADRLGEARDDIGQYGSASGDLLAADEQYLLGSIGRVVWAGAHRVLCLPRALAELGARCVPVAGEPGEGECATGHAAGDEGGDETRAGCGAEEDECANDEALARALQECEWYEARQHGRLPAAAGSHAAGEGAALETAGRGDNGAVRVERGGEGRVGRSANRTAPMQGRGRGRDGRSPPPEAQSGGGCRRRQRSPPHARSSSRAAAREFEREWQQLRDEFAAQTARRPGPQARTTLAPLRDHHALGRGVWIDPSEMTYDEIIQMQDMIGVVSRGADDAQIAALPTETFRACGEVAGSGRVECSACCVCLEDFLDGDALRRLDCCHRFHVACIDPWLASNRACPICKADAC